MNLLPISLIIPTYNRKSLLERALHSVFEQTMRPKEVIVVDDNSDDGTGAWMQSWVRRYPTVQYHYLPRQGGVSHARNCGLSLASEAWLAFLDSDDSWFSHKLERQWRALQENPEYLFCHTNEIWIRDGRRVNAAKKHEKKGGFIFQHCLPMCRVSPSSVVLHRGLLEHVGQFDESLPACEDYDLWLRICAEFPVLYLEENLITKYGGHTDQLSRRYWGMDRFRIQALTKILRSGRLNAADRAAAAAQLRQKIEVYVQGLEKREKWVEAARYRALSTEFEAIA